MNLKIAIIIGSTRPGRLGESVANWVAAQAANRAGADYELVDLADFNLTLLAEPTVPGAANKQYENPQTREWSKVVDSYDGYVFVTPEYNHGVPAALKNAFDLLGSEWSDKALGLVGYGAAGGVRAIEQWRVIAANLRLIAVRDQVSLSLFNDFGPNGFDPDARHAADLAGELDQLEQLSRALHTVRTGE
ncbi:NADPH-dependent FMN reductase [Enemella evansiae]|uniref:NADPH-dependent FMN reductase n=1 Tax=Enemella evansiae TaxID=2016499 RepID=UPI000C01041E|nr:NAD(P)H-dependent oxidoreductase [Enemella evansiae]PFG68133.1 NAD(P)H-dependent FMN reductase [Propionibacteriaceae bacterium ES.041]TDO86275.1 NAD(P)H-dependent FMN reductase [Enemella evansiae]